jgi:hypothetical protein
MKKFFFIFLIAFGLNWIWENLHSLLYVHYQGGEITQFILTRASLFDALFIAAIIFLSRVFKKERARNLFIVSAGIFLAVAIELWAFNTGRWSYGPYMPLVPFLGTGLTPTVQLAFLGYVSKKLAERIIGLINKKTAS